MNDAESKVVKSFNWPVLLVITGGGIVAGIYRNGIMTLFPFLQNEYHLTRTQVGLYSTFLYFSSVLVAVFAGRIADKWGVKRSMTWGLSCMGLFVLLHSFAPNFLFVLLFAALTGLGLSIIMPTASKGIAEWFSGSHQATAMGIMTLGFALGGVIGASFLPWSANNYSWRTSVTILGIIYFIVSLIFSRLYYNKTANKQKKENRESLFGKDVFKLFKSRYLVTLCLLGIVFGVVSGVIVTHFTLYLYLDFGFSEVAAGLGFMLLQIGSMVGRPGWGIINDKLLGGNERIGFSILGLLIVLLSLVFAAISNYNPSLLIILSLVFLMGNIGRGWQGLYFSAISEQVGEENTGMGIGLSLLFVRGGIMIGPPIFGLIADKTGSYSDSWLLLAIFMFIATILSNYYLKKYQNN